MRIITGIYKGRHFEIPRSFKARPTTDFAKENIFNVLNGLIDFEDATALDLFAGTGSVSNFFLKNGCEVYSCDNMTYSICEEYRTNYYISYLLPKISIIGENNKLLEQE